jgi:hypothetical protein
MGLRKEEDGEGEECDLVFFVCDFLLLDILFDLDFLFDTPCKDDLPFFERVKTDLIIIYIYHI